VTFYNSETGFCVLPVKARGQRDLITVIGQAAMISAGEFVQNGTWINDHTHGVQFRASFLKAIGDGAVRTVPRVNGEMRCAVKLLVAPESAERASIGERSASFDLDPDQSHRFLSPHTIDVRGILS
jgi:exodeoxyribonuclease V alpha subunit